MAEVIDTSCAIEAVGSLRMACHWDFLNITRETVDSLVYCTMLMDTCVNANTQNQIYKNKLQTCIYQYSRTRRWRKFQKGKIYNAEEHVAIESFVTTLIH